MALSDDSNFAVLVSAFHVHSTSFPTPSAPPTPSSTENQTLTCTPMNSPSALIIMIVTVDVD